MEGEVTLIISGQQVTVNLSDCLKVNDKGLAYIKLPTGIDENGRYVYRNVYYSMPQDISSSVNVQAYFPSKTNYNADREFPAFMKYNEELGGSNIVITMSNVTGSNGTTSPNALSSQQMDNLSAIFSAMMDKPTQVNFNNFSACSLGGSSALKSFTNKLDTTNGDEQLFLTVYDASTIDAREYKGNPFAISDTNQRIQKMLDSDSAIRILSPNSHVKYWTGSNWVNYVASKGVKTVIITTQIEKESFGHGSGMVRSTQDGWQDFFDGKINFTDINDNGQGYCILLPTVDENGNVTWPKKITVKIGRKTFKQYDDKYTLTYYQELMKNYLNLTEEQKSELMGVLNYLEGTRVKVDYDYLNGVSDINDAAKTLFADCESRLFDYSSSSKLLPTELGLIMKTYEKSSNLIGNLGGITSKVSEAAEGMKQTEASLTTDTNNVQS